MQTHLMAEQIANDQQRIRHLTEALEKIAAMTSRDWHGEDYLAPGEKPGWVEVPTPAARIARAALNIE